MKEAANFSMKLLLGIVVVFIILFGLYYSIVTAKAWVLLIVIVAIIFILSGFNIKKKSKYDHFYERRKAELRAEEEHRRGGRH